MAKYFNFNHLYYFLTVANEGSITEACKKLCITQPTLSTQLKNFEDALGFKLFDRKKKRLHLNQKGEVALHYASQIFNLKEEMLENLSEKASPDKIKEIIRVGTLTTLSKSKIFEFINPLWRHSNIEVQLTEGHLPNLKKSMQSGKLDLILTDNVIPGKNQGFAYRRVFSRDIVAVSHPKFKRYRIKFPQSLANLPFMNVSGDSTFRKEIDMLFYSENIFPPIIGEADDTAILTLAAKAGKCFIIVPKCAVEQELKDKSLIVLGTFDDIQSDVWAITRKESIQKPIVSKTIDYFHSKLV
ncbi:MAG: LysR family transcriptional regulator [Deltaproteobacteria bacterium]|nr:LysR family transcriptional regulator [Deltaproteobacteria bacterium]